MRLGYDAQFVGRDKRPSDFDGGPLGAVGLAAVNIGVVGFMTWFSVRDRAVRNRGWLR